MHNTLKIFLMSLFVVTGGGCQFFSAPPEGNPEQNTPSSRWQAGGPEQVFFKAYQTEAADTVYRDTLWLRLHREHSDTLRGTYVWLVPGKDGKRGSVEGSLVQGAFLGLYHYQQEGGDYSDSIRIDFSDGGAIVTQRQASGGLLIDTLESLGK